MATGRLQVRVTTQMILPIENAQILITEADTALLLDSKTVYTGKDGTTAFIELNTVPKELSLDENNDLLPYRAYNIFVFANGFMQAEALGINIFDGQDTLQWIDLMARPIDYGSEFEIRTSKEDPHNLYNSQPYAKVGGSENA